MAKLKQLTCSIEISTADTKLREYNTQYSDGCVETFIAVPSAPIRFSIHLEQDGYIAPGLAMFVFMDGVYQCNRNRRGLLLPGEGVPKERTQTEFRVRQKEEKCREGGRFIGRDWTFEALKLDEANNAADLNPDFLFNVGTIEVVLLRCKNEGEDVPTPAVSFCETMDNVAPTRQTTPPSAVKSATKSAGRSNAGSGGLGGLSGLFDGSNDLAFGLDGLQDGRPLLEFQKLDAPLVDHSPYPPNLDGAGDQQYQHPFQPQKPLAAVNGVHPWEQAVHGNDGLNQMQPLGPQQQGPQLAFGMQGVEAPDSIYFHADKGVYRPLSAQPGGPNWTRDDRSALYHGQQAQDNPGAYNDKVQAQVDGHYSIPRETPQIVINQYGNPGQSALAGQIPVAGAQGLQYQAQNGLQQQQPHLGYGIQQQYQPAPKSLPYNQQPVEKNAAYQNQQPGYGQPNQQVDHGQQGQQQPQVGGLDPNAIINMAALLKNAFLNPGGAQQPTPAAQIAPGLAEQQAAVQNQQVGAVHQPSNVNVPTNRNTVDRTIFREIWDLPKYPCTPRGSSIDKVMANPWENPEPRWKKGEFGQVLKNKKPNLAGRGEQKAVSASVDHFPGQGQTYQGWQQNPHRYNLQIGEGGSKMLPTSHGRGPSQYHAGQDANQQYGGQQGYNGHSPAQGNYNGGYRYGQQYRGLNGNGYQAYRNGNANQQYGKPTYVHNDNEYGYQQQYNNGNANGQYGQQDGYQNGGNNRQWNGNANQDNKDGNNGGEWNNADQQNGNNNDGENQNEQRHGGHGENWNGQQQQNGGGGSWEKNIQKSAGDHGKHNDNFQSQNNNNGGHEGWANHENAQPAQYDGGRGVEAWHDEAKSQPPGQKIMSWNDGSAEKFAQQDDDKSAFQLKDSVKPYFKTWQSPQAPLQHHPGESNTKKSRTEPREVYTHAQSPLPAVPTAAASKRNISYGVQAGKGAPYSHRCARPVYLDDMEHPYAVFRFKYRSKDVLERLLGCSIKDDVSGVRKVSERARLLALSKEELAEELLRVKRDKAWSASKTPPEQHNEWGSKVHSQSRAGSGNGRVTPHPLSLHRQRRSAARQGGNGNDRNNGAAGREQQNNSHGAATAWGNDNGGGQGDNQQQAWDNGNGGNNGGAGDNGGWQELGEQAYGGGNQNGDMKWR